MKTIEAGTCIYPPFSQNFGRRLSRAATDSHYPDRSSTAKGPVTYSGEVPSILVVDDDPAIAELVEIHMTGEGYTVHKAYDGPQAIKILEGKTVHLVVLDIMMPGMTGIEVCRHIRKTLTIPIIMLSVKSMDEDKVLGLSCGADDYVAKPFNVLELLARVKSQLRRYLHFGSSSPAAPEDRIVAGGLAIDKPDHRACVYGREVFLTHREFDILAFLASQPGRVFSAEAIFRNVWADRYFDSNNTVMVHIRKIREKIEINPGKPEILKTVWGVGYKIDV